MFDALIQHLFPGGRLLSSRPLKGGISAEMTVLEIEDADGGVQKIVARLQGERSFGYSPRGIPRQYKVQKLLSGAGLGVPAPLYLDAEGDLFGTPCMVMEFVEGVPEYRRDHGKEIAVQAAEWLAKIHTRFDNLSQWSFLPRISDRIDDWLADRPKNPNDALQETRIRDLLESVWPDVVQNKAMLVHGDFWPGNLLWQDGRIVSVVDWEEPVTGDPLSDMAISRLDLLFAFDAAVMDTFTEKYFSLVPAVRTEFLPHWDLFAALRPTGNLDAWAAGWPAFGRADVTVETMIADHTWFVNQAVERITS